MSITPHQDTIISIQQVSFGYTTERVLEDITFNIHRGDYLGVIGPNGGGKTTLLKLLLGLLQPNSGSISIFGHPPLAISKQGKLGYVPQKVATIDSRFPSTVEEIVLMGRYAKRGLLKRITAEDHTKANQALEQVDMLPYRKRLIGDLSGGQQQRVFIARALATEAEVLLLDEPTVGVDIQNQELFYKLLHTLNVDLGLTLIIVSHDIDIIAKETTELACINKHLTYHGDASAFLKQPNFTQQLYGKNVQFINHHHTS